MKIKTKKIISIVLVLVLAFSFSACKGKDSNKYTENGYTNNYNTEYEASYEADYDGGFYDAPEEAIAGDSVTTSRDETTTVNEDGGSYEAKIITTYSMTIDSETYDESIKGIKEKLKELGGYVESESSYNYSNGSRYSYLTLRVPAAKAEAWAEEFGNYGTVRSSSRNSEDVTLTYVDYQSKIEALRTEESSLLEIMAAATEVSDLILIEDQLAYVRGQIESYQSQLNVLQNKVSYTTISLTINEVTKEVPVIKNMTIFEEAKLRLSGLLSVLGDIGRELVILLMVLLPFIVVIAVVVVIIVMLAKSAKKRRIKKAMKKAEESTNQNTENK